MAERRTFLTQDPIGLAGGTNLYAYAGNNPVGFSDPFGLCERPAGLKKGEVGICIQTFIAGASPGVPRSAADNRTFSSSGGTFRTDDSFIVGSSGVRDVSSGTGKTLGVLPGIGTPQHTSTMSGGTTTVTATTNSRTMLPYPPANINYNLTLTVDEDGGVKVTGTHDGYPSYEIWAYREGKDPELVYEHVEGTVDQLGGCCDVQVK